MSLLSTLAAHDLGYLPTDRLLARLDADPAHGREPRALPGTPAQLVRHGHAGAAPSALRLHGRQRQPRGRAPDPGAGAAGAREPARRPSTQRLEGLADTAAVLRTVSSSHGRLGQPSGRSRRSTASRGPSPPRPAAAVRRPAWPRSRSTRRELGGGGRGDRSAGTARRSRRGRRTGGTRVLDALDGLAREPVVVPAVLCRRSPPACAPSWTGCASTSSTTGGAASSRSATAWPTPRARAASTGSFYDLLASEARLASFIAIAKGDVPQQHWFHLGRLVTNVDGRAALISWGGTMFEYLMPQLLMRSFAGTLLDQSCRAAVRRQIDYGRQRGVPWGISESAYAFTDREGTYQYRAFGVPGLGLRRGLVTDLVIAPYATALASQVSPAAAVENFDRLAAEGLEGRYGFYESVDYNPREPRRRRRAAGTPCVPSSSAPTSPTTRGCRSWRWPTSSARTCSWPGSTPIPACRPRSCCSRSGCRAKRSCRSRGRPRPRRRRRRCRCSRRAGSCRRRAPPSTRTSSRTGATPRR